jgi:DNA (cytosine-5)-methyltransferase 1
MSKNDKTNGNTLRVFEAFAGIGAQATALKRLNIKYEIVGISDWFVNAIICYDAIHCSDKEIEIPSYEEQVKYLNRFQFSGESVHPIKNIKSIGKDVIEQLYVANKRSNNYGSISQLHGWQMPEIDLLVYSFPCQDLSSGGNSLGMKKGSGTRSCLLWEIERILQELKEINRLPEYLLLENVKNILAKVNRSDLDEWLNFLTSIGYQNDDCMLLDASDFGVPQDRQRAFIVSHLGSKTNVEKKIIKQEKNFPVSKFLKTDYSNPIYKEEADIAQLNRTPSREVMWEKNGRRISDNENIHTITCNMDRTNTAALFRYSGAKGNTYRRLTIREAFLLMGFTEEEYEKTLYLDFSYRQMNKLIGNSIVVNVLAEIFRALFSEKYGKEESV